jgi:anti-anti-sigma regulatory factor
MAKKKSLIALPELVDSEYASKLISLYSTADTVTDPVTFDASQVERLTTVGVQPIIALMRASNGVATASAILDASPAFRAAWADFGLNHHFPLEQ